VLTRSSMRSLCLVFISQLGTLVGCGSEKSGGATATDDGYVPAIDGRWTRSTDEYIDLVGPGLYATSGPVKVTVNYADGTSEMAPAGQLNGRTISFSFSEPHTINLLNDSQLALDGAEPVYEKVFTPDVNLYKGFWCEVGSTVKFTLDVGQSTGQECFAGVPERALVGTRTDASGATEVTGILCPSNPSTDVYSASVRQFTWTPDGGLEWAGEFVGESRIELVSSERQLTLRRRSPTDGCD